MRYEEMFGCVLLFGRSFVESWPLLLVACARCLGLAGVTTILPKYLVNTDNENYLSR